MKLILLSILVTSFGCALSPMKYESSKVIAKDEILTSSADLETLTANLSRAKNTPNVYVVEVVYLSQPLVVAMARDAAKRALASESEITQRIDKNLKIWRDKETCFQFTIGTFDIEAGYYKDIVAKLIDSDGHETKLEFANVHGTRSIATADPFYGYQWQNSSPACAPKIDETKPFKIVVSHTKLEAAPVELSWVVQ